MRCIAAIAFLLALIVRPCVLAQPVETLFLTDPFDNRPTATRLESRLGHLEREAYILEVLRENLMAASVFRNDAAFLQSLVRGDVAPPQNSRAKVLGLVTLGSSRSPNRELRVYIGQTGSPVIFYAEVRDSVRWEIVTEPGVELQAIYLESDEPALAVTAPPGVPVVLRDRTTGGSYRGGLDPEFSPEAKALVTAGAARRTGLLPTVLRREQRVSALIDFTLFNRQFREELASALAEIQVQAAEESRQSLIENYRSAQFQVLLSPPRLAPPQPTRLALATPFLRGPELPFQLPFGVQALVMSRGGVLYGLIRGEVLHYDAVRREFRPMLGSPSNVTGLHVDQDRDRLIAVSSSLAGGALHTFEEARQRWTILATIPPGIVYGSAWNPADRRSYLLVRRGISRGPLELRRLDAQGRIEALVILPIDVWFDGLGIDGAQLIPVGGLLQIVGPPLLVEGVYARQAYLVRPSDGAVLAATVFAD